MAQEEGELPKLPNTNKKNNLIKANEIKEIPIAARAKGYLFNIGPGPAAYSLPPYFPLI